MRAPAGRGGRGGGRGGFGGGRGGFGGGRGGRGGGRGRGGRGYDEGPPEYVVELGDFMHPCEGEMVYKLTNEMVPYFNAGAYLENKTKIGKVDEIFGPVNEIMFTVKPDTGVIATSFKKGDKVWIGTDKLLPMSRFTGGGAGGRPGGEGGGRESGGRPGGRAGGAAGAAGA
ncbi:unnamed protein product, partial [Heterosigma akashiwo]